MLGLQPGQMGMSASGMNPYSAGGMGAGQQMGFGQQMGGDPLGMSGWTGMNNLMMQQQSSGQMMEQMMAVMGMVMNMMMMKQMQGMVSSMANFGGGSASGGGTPGVGNFLGGNSGGATGASEASPGVSESAGGDGNGSKAVEIAQKYLGQKSGNINNMANFTHAGGMTNNCADFVSACLANAGTYKKKPGDASVRILKQHLQEDGWKKVSKAQAKPGDVAIFNGSQHVELVATKGATQLIGSNNKGNASTQTVSTDSGNWGSVEYFAK